MRAAALLFLCACSGGAAAVRATPAERAAAPDVEGARVALTAKLGPAQAPRIERGLQQAASLWRPEDGDLKAFALEQLVPAGQDGGTEALLARFEEVLEQIDGHMLELSREAQRATQVDVGPLLPVDALFNAWSPSAHLSDDLFHEKVAFSALLNFPLHTLAERLAHEREYTRREWAADRLTARFSRRVPADVSQRMAAAEADASAYIDAYNLYMHHLVTGSGERPFPKGLRLISHWNLRDELKADYADPNGAVKQALILQVLHRIVTQSIPQAVIDNPRLDWNPFSNQVTKSPVAEIEPGGSGPAEPNAAPEPCTRYQKLLSIFQAHRGADPYSPVAPTALARSFEERQMSEERAVALLNEVLDSPLVPRVAAEIERRLGRPLAPQDLWYAGFQPRGAFSEEKLDALTRARYPDVGAFQADLPRILRTLGFSKEKAAFLVDHIRVDPARGAGHALQAERRGDFPRLRTRFEKGGMDYKGFNIAIHELGHNVEQVFSLYEVDSPLLKGVPNNAFTEALAFVFQGRDLAVLDLQPGGPEADRARALNDFWVTWEIAGVALVDLQTWHWMYAHPDATPEALRDAVVEISRKEWNRHYAPVLHARDVELLGVYSHMVSYPLYLASYPLGHLIAAQIEARLKAAPALGPEFERMAKEGDVTPDEWMRNATGAPVGTQALLEAAERAM
jgi:hypothetical protein